MSATTVNPPNLRRLETPGHSGWTRSARPGDPRKYFIVSADAHVNEPATLWLERMDMWGNDYPHHEGTWPHSAQAIERTMGGLGDAARARVLGLNAARFFGFAVPATAR